MKTKVFFTLALVTLVLACKKDNEKDTTKPVIELLEPANGDTLFIGYETHLEMDLSDNDALGSYKIDIHNNVDNHGHSTKSAVESQTWEYSKSWNDIEGKRNTHVHHHEIYVPDSINGKPIAQGNYHFMLYCTDKAGNETYVVRSIVVGAGVPHLE